MRNEIFYNAQNRGIRITLTDDTITNMKIFRLKFVLKIATRYQRKRNTMRMQFFSYKKLKKKLKEENCIFKIRYKTNVSFR